jgi:hypothetical protein
MAMDSYPGKIWDVSHKIMAVEAGLGHMGANRLVLDPKYGSCIQPFVLREKMSNLFTLKTRRNMLKGC